MWCPRSRRHTARSTVSARCLGRGLARAARRCHWADETAGSTTSRKPRAIARDRAIDDSSNVGPRRRRDETAQRTHPRCVSGQERRRDRLRPSHQPLSVVEERSRLHILESEPPPFQLIILLVGDEPHPRPETHHPANACLAEPAVSVVYERTTHGRTLRPSSLGLASQRLYVTDEVGGSASRRRIESVACPWAAIYAIGLAAPHERRPAETALARTTHRAQGGRPAKRQGGSTARSRVHPASLACCCPCSRAGQSGDLDDCGHGGPERTTHHPRGFLKSARSPDRRRSRPLFVSAPRAPR